MKNMKMMAMCGCLAAACGCMTSPIDFKATSAPVPQQGYTVIGSDVRGESMQIWVFGLGGSLSMQQHSAYKQALGNAHGADALVGMSIESHSSYFWPFYIQQTISVTGTPVKFNPPPAK